MIAPVLARLRAEGFAIAGPLAADSMFHAAARARYDAAVCMYHDQALIPLKTLDFAGGVNVTLGLDFVRTSPDHGTAYDIAADLRADPTSLIAALRLARSSAKPGPRADDRGRAPPAAGRRAAAGWTQAPRRRHAGCAVAPAARCGVSPVARSPTPERGRAERPDTVPAPAVPRAGGGRNARQRAAQRGQTPLT